MSLKDLDRESEDDMSFKATAIFMIIAFALLGLVLWKSYEVGNYKAKYSAALDWIRDEIPSEGEAEVMKAIESVIEQKCEEEMKCELCGERIWFWQFKDDVSNKHLKCLIDITNPFTDNPKLREMKRKHYEEIENLIKEQDEKNR